MLGTGVVIRLNGVVKKGLTEKVIVKGREYVLWISGEEHSRQREDRSKGPEMWSGTFRVTRRQMRLMPSVHAGMHRVHAENGQITEDFEVSGLYS